MKTTRCTTALMLLTGALAQTVPPAAGQAAAAAPASEPPIELSPFEVTASTATPWVATETLAGSRLRTNLKDVPNQIETFTKDFMSDLALTSVEQAMSYAANVENDFDYPNPGMVTNPAGGARIRGINTGTRSRNFFQVSTAPDNFNIERVTVASGPNAILFGLGSPAGIFDTTPARALMRNKYGFELSYDSEDSKRATFDTNTVVVPQKLAVRLMGLSKREYTEKTPNLDRDERLYGALTFTPFKHTTLIVQGEKANRNWNRAPRVLPYDNVTLWLNANQIPGSGYPVAKPVFNNTSLTGIGTNRIFTQAADLPIMIQGDAGPMRGWRNSVTVKNPSARPNVDQTFDAAIDTTILDPAIFPFDVNLAGTSRTVLLGGTTKTAILEQKLATHLFLELAYNHENAYENGVAAGGQVGNSLFKLEADANQFIPGTTTPNPNLGRMYFQGRANNDISFSRHEDWRATLSYEFDVARRLSDRGGLAKWLGRHRFSGLYTTSDERSKNQGNFERRILDNPVIAGQTLRAKSFRNWATHASRRPQYRHYFNSPYEETTAAGSFTGEWTRNDANGKPFTLYLFDTPFEAADGKRLGGGGAASGKWTKTDAQIFAWQGFFLPDRERLDRLVLTFGYRKDSAKVATLDDGSLQQDFSGLYPVLWDTSYGAFGATQAGINRNFGVVARPLKWLSAFYNQSTTFDLNTGTYDPFGNDMPGAGGKGKDYGLRFDLWNDKVTLRLNKYENTLSPRRTANQINKFRDIYFRLEDRVLELNPDTPTINVTDGTKRGFRNAGVANYAIMADVESTGYEVELNLMPVRNWSIRVNGSKSEAVESNIGLPWIAWGNARLPVWQTVVASNGEVDAAGKPVTWKTASVSATAPTGQTLEQYYSSALVGEALAFMQAADGRATDNARTARANLITNYRFSEGRCKGFNLGGAGRWRSAPALGYGVTTSSSGSTILDLDRSYRGKAELYFDAFLGYRGRMKAFGGFAYRLQLNVRNVLDENEPVPVAAHTTGAIVKIATVEPRVTVFTFAVDF